MTKKITPEDIQYAGHAVGFTSDGHVTTPLIRCVAAHSLPQQREYTPNELRAAFDHVKNKENWKYPIDAEIDEKDMPLIDAAIAFMAYGFAEFETLGNGRVRVKAPGYYGAESIMESQLGGE